MKTIQFRFVPDEILPMFKRLEWDVVDISFREVLEQGIHPWAEDNTHRDLVEAFVKRLNLEVHKPSGLLDHSILSDVVLGPSNHWTNTTRFEQVLDNIKKNVWFCDAHLDFPLLSKIARRRLTEQWDSGLALKLAKRLCPSFQELRRFLKTKDGSVKLRGQMDLSEYDWSQVLSLEDFGNHERLLIGEAVVPLNFRKTTFLDSVTDDQRRLRLVNAVDHVMLTQPATVDHRVPILWQAERKGSHWRLRPNVGASREARSGAQEFASRWRRDTGKLCCTARTQDVIDIVNSGSASASFPGLRYTLGQYSPKVAAQTGKAKVPLYVLGGIPNYRWSVERLKEVLREYGASTTGVKKVLVEKIAELAESEYDLHEPMLNGFFSENHFVRVSRDIRYGEQLPVLGRDTLKGLLLHLYALRHLRGNVVIDTSYENDSCAVKELADALISGRLSVLGGFIRVN